MEVQLQNISKRYLFDWIIKDLTHKFDSGSCTGITGINGSGKSTLVKMLSGWLSPSKGKVQYTKNGLTVKVDSIYKSLSIVAPYTDIIQEYDLQEMYNFHVSFRPLPNVVDYKAFTDIVHLKGQLGKPLAYYSSGMKQRVQLALALLSDTSLLLLDEPTSYLDIENKKWFYNLLENVLADRTVIISSNDAEDLQFCKGVLQL